MSIILKSTNDNGHIYYVADYPNLSYQLIIATEAHGEKLKVFSYANTFDKDIVIPEIIHQVYPILVRQFIVEHYIMDYSYILYANKHTNGNFLWCRPYNIFYEGDSVIDWENTLPLCFNSRDYRWAAKMNMIYTKKTCTNVISELKKYRANILQIDVYNPHINLKNSLVEIGNRTFKVIIMNGKFNEYLYSLLSFRAKYVLFSSELYQNGKCIQVLDRQIEVMDLI